MYYEQDKLGLIEFSETFYDSLDTVLTTSLIHVEENQAFYDDIVFKMYDVYQRENNNFYIKDLVTFFHIFLHSMFKNQPDTNRDEDEIRLK